MPNRTDLKEIPVYFILDKDLPGAKAGCQFSPGYDIGGEPIIHCDEIKFPYRFAEENPDWFIPVMLEEHQRAIKDSFFEHGRSTGHTDEQNEIAWQIMLN
jgi:hypothetical protein